MNKPLNDVDFLRWTIAQAAAPRHAGTMRIDTQRREILRLLKDSPSLKREVPALVADELPDDRALVARAAARHRETRLADPGRLDFDAHQVLDDRYPPEP